MKNTNTTYLLLIAVISAMGGLLFGYDWVVIGGAKPFYEQFFGIANNSTLQGWAMSSALIGCLVGALSAGYFSDKYGRKPLLIAASVLFLASAVGTGATDSFDWFIFYRIVGGFGIGVASNLSPMYIAEISPAAYRGRLVALNQMTIVLGILMAQVVNMLIAEPIADGASADIIRESWNGQQGWRWMFWAECVPAGLFFLFAFVIPESPRWLLANGKADKAIRVMSRLTTPEVAAVEAQQVTRSLESEAGESNWHILRQPKVLKILLIGITLAVFQQWCGINVIFNYAQEIFAAAGYGVSDMLMNIVITGAINVIFTFVAILLVDRIGRRPLMLFGALGLTIIYAMLGSSYYFGVTGWLPLLLVVMAIGCYAMSLAAVMWVVISEIFPNRIRGMAMAISTFALWSACFVLTYTFPILNSSLGTAFTFWLYGGICLAGYLFILKRLPETKGKSLEQIESELV